LELDLTAVDLRAVDLTAVDPWIWAMIVGVGIFAGYINTLVGGGTLLVVPLLIEVVQIPPHLANGTNRLCVAFQAAVALWVLSRGSSDSSEDRAFLKTIPLPVAILVGVAALPGAWLASILPAEELRQTLGFLVLLAVSFFMFSGSVRTGDAIGEKSVSLSTPGIVMASLACGVYGGFIGAGIGAFIILMFTTSGVEIEKAVRWKVFLVWLLSTVSGLYYLFAGHFSLLLAIPLLLAYAIGGFLGGKSIIRGSEKWLKSAVGVVSASLALLMLFGNPIK
jgi:uncharacterized membrane protein YfcA